MHFTMRSVNVKRAGIFFVACYLLLVSGTAMAAFPNDLVLNDQTVQNGQILEYYAYRTVTAGPSYVVESGGDVKLRSSGTIRLLPGFHAKSGSKLLLQIVSEPPNHPPVADAVTVNTSEDVQVKIPLSGWDEDGDPLTYSVMIAPQHGQIQGSYPDLYYSPNPNYFGSDSFAYKANDGRADSNTASVSLTILPVNDAPVAVADNYSIHQNKSLTISAPGILGNDQDMEKDPLTAILVSSVSYGSLSLNADGSFIYTPNPGSLLTDSFTYKVSDGQLQSSAATVTIQITSKPVALYQSISTPSNTSVQIILTGADVLSKPLTFELISIPKNGSLQGTPPNLTYTPNQNVYGDDSFTFRVKNGTEYSDPAMVNIHVKTPKPLVSFTGFPSVVKPGSQCILSWMTQYADKGVVITPGINSVPTNHSMAVSPASTVNYKLTATGEGGVTEAYFQVSVDSEAPKIEAVFPEENGQVNLEALQAGLLVSFSDNSGVASVKIYRINNETEIDVTGQSVIGDHSIRLDISSLTDGSYRFKLVIMDIAGNITIRFLNFTIDKTVPVTTVSIQAGKYSKPFTVDLTCSEQATIFYSIDGSPPFPGGSNTISGPAPIQGIAIDHSLNLQFFAKDLFGNSEPLKSVIYLLGEIPEAIIGLNAQYNTPRVNLVWAKIDKASAYRVYRALSKVDIDILNQSQKGRYAPPKRLRYSTDISKDTPAYADTNVSPGMTYYYGVTQVDQSGAEGVISQLVSVSIPESGIAADKTEAVKRSLAWLEFSQKPKGFWGDNENTGVPATSQVLNAYQKVNKSDLNTQYALFYLRSHKNDNNDYLARKILTLYAFGQNVDMFINILNDQGYYSGSYLYGWGLNSHYAYDALDNALGRKAAECTSPAAVIRTNYAADSLKVTASLQSNTAGRFSWVTKGEPSVYVSSLVYEVVNKKFPTLSPFFNQDWILNFQLPDGSFGKGLIDTSAVLLWISPLTPEQKQKAIDYLIFHQKTNGSWNNDPYLTGLCLEALLK